MDGRISRREFVKRATILGMSGGAIGAVLAACGGTAASQSAAPASAAHRSHGRPGQRGPIGVVGSLRPDALRRLDGQGRLVDGERDEVGLKAKIAEIKDTMGITVELTTLALGALLEANNQNLLAPESAFDIVHVLGFSVAGTVGADLVHRDRTVARRPDEDARRLRPRRLPEGPARLLRILRRRDRRVRWRPSSTSCRDPQRLVRAVLPEGPARRQAERRRPEDLGRVPRGGEEARTRAACPATA